MKTMLSLALSMLLASLGTSIANVALPALTVAFDATFQQVQWVVLAYLLAVTTLIVSAGRFGDLLGRRRLLLTGIGVFTAASLLCGVAPSLGMLIAARAVQGLGAAVMMALTLAFVADAVPKEKTGSAMGLLGTMSAIGTALGPSLCGLLLARFGWPSIFFVNVPLGIVTFVLAYHALPMDRPSVRKATFDHPGTLLLASTLGAYALAVTIGRGTFGVLNALLLIGAIAGVAVFVKVEASSPSPLIRLTIFRDAVRSGGFAMSALVTTVVMATLVVGPFYLAKALQLEAAQVGLAMSVGPIVAALTGVPAGRIVDRFGASRMTMAGLFAMAAGSSLLPLMPIAFGVAGYLAPLVIVTAGYALFQAANNTTVMADLQPDQRGVVSGMLNLSRNLGLITGASVMGAVFAFGAKTSDIMRAPATSIASGMRFTFVVATMLIIAALAIASASRREITVAAAADTRP